MAIKKGFLSVPHEGWGGVPLDTLIANLFEHAYEHWWTHKHHLKWRFTTRFIKFGFFVMGGSTAGYNQWVGKLPEVRRGEVTCPHIGPHPAPIAPHLTHRTPMSSYLSPAGQARVSHPVQIDGGAAVPQSADQAEGVVVLVAVELEREGRRQVDPRLRRAHERQRHHCHICRRAHL